MSMLDFHVFLIKESLMKTLEKVNPKVSVSASRVKKLSVLAVFLSSDKSGLPQYL